MRWRKALRTSDPDQDVAVILVSSHGEMIQGKFYLIPYGVDLGSQNASRRARSPGRVRRESAAIAAHARVLLLLDACHSGAVGPEDGRPIPMRRSCRTS